jgi:glutamate synthase domain-containing protein 3
VAERLLQRWGDSAPAFVKVMPRDYKRALARLVEAAAGAATTAAV